MVIAAITGGLLGAVGYVGFSVVRAFTPGTKEQDMSNKALLKRALVGAFWGAVAVGGFDYAVNGQGRDDAVYCASQQQSLERGEELRIRIEEDATVRCEVVAPQAFN
ncbi:MAG: hypothetical protein GC136_07190 [Alphaproteobacteria bacterium]|nr:hypothetical protein [Alphaproteobacteria bacterium]